MMKIRRFLRALVQCAILLSFILLLMVNPDKAQDGKAVQDKTVLPVSDKTYKQVLDLLFPLDGIENNNYEFAWVLRFRPSEEADSQIIIVKSSNGIEVTEATSLDGNIYNKLNEILQRTGREDANEMAKLIHVRRRLVAVSPVLVEQWRSSFARSIYELMRPNRPQAKDNTALVFVHGTFYDLRYKTGEVEIRYSVLGPEINGSTIPKTLPIEKWMYDVLREVKRKPSKVR